MHFWDINLNSISAINLALAVGLTVDFSAHIGLAFMESVGTRQERAINALGNLGPPLVHGGFSTFLAISVLAFAKSYVFRIFFKMFLLIIGLGMWHGLTLVPQLLSLVGPSGYFTSGDEKGKEEDELAAQVLGSDKVNEDGNYVNTGLTPSGQVELVEA